MVIAIPRLFGVEGRHKVGHDVETNARHRVISVPAP